MTALGHKCAEIGWFHSEAVADAAITDGSVYKDANGDVVCIGKAGRISTGALSRVEPDASPLTQYFVPPPKKKHT